MIHAFSSLKWKKTDFDSQQNEALDDGFMNEDMIIIETRIDQGLEIIDCQLI